MSGAQKENPGAAATATEANNVSTPDGFKYTESPISKLLHRLDQSRETGRGQYLARCPAHDDGSPSLSVRESSDGTVLMHCFAGCPASDVLAAVGMELAELFPDYGRREARPKRRGERRINPLDTLRAVDHEVHIVAVVAADMRAHRTVDDATMRRLTLAVSRIGAARGLYQ